MNVTVEIEVNEVAQLLRRDLHKKFHGTFRGCMYSSAE
jgi:hypothetical protein